VAARFGGFYMTHIRDEADRSFEALREAIAIGEQARISVQISHIKLGTVGVWGKSAEAVGAERALADVGGAANITITECAAHKDYEFRTLEEIAKSKGVSPVELFIQIVKDGGASVIGKSMIDSDIRTFYRQQWVMVASDGGVGMRHPRAAGTFPKVLGRYVRVEHWLSLPEAIRKMTSLPAARLRLADRGSIRSGMKADLVLFNPTTVIDRSTFSDPQKLSEGIEKVFVNGELVWDAGKAIGARPGSVLSR